MTLWLFENVEYNSNKSLWKCKVHVTRGNTDYGL